MEDKEIVSTLKGILDNQKEVAKKFEMISKGTKDTEPTYVWKGKYDPYLLEPILISEILGITEGQLERVIMDSESYDLQEEWRQYKKLGLISMMYDSEFGQVRAQLAEFALGKFDKNETTKTDAILKLPTKELTEALLEIKRLKKLVGEE